MRKHHKKSSHRKTPQKFFFRIKYISILLPLFIIAVGVYLYTNVLPYHFSDQKPLEMENLTGIYDKSAERGVFHNQEVVSQFIPDKKEQLAQVLGESNGNKRIEVDLTNQRMYAFEGDKKIFDFPVSSGLWGRTPTGTFTIWTKLRYTKMEGGSTALNTYYYLPNVPFVMFFANAQVPASRGYSLHGTYWHNNFGHPMSHGCVNMRTEDVEHVYYWANPDLRGKPSMAASADNPGTPIIIYGEAPSS